MPDVLFNLTALVSLAMYINSQQAENFGLSPAPGILPDRWLLLGGGVYPDLPEKWVWKSVRRMRYS